MAKKRTAAHLIVLGAIVAGCLPDTVGNDTTGPGVPVEIPAVASVWLRERVIPITTADPTASLDELEPLRALVADAGIVALGEATHGTREFFRMKHRLLRFLVERMGFDAFAIEATWPEANRLDHYVRTGDGDPEVLLSGLYFWTWNTEEVLDMIHWMRAHNAAGGNVGFHGFDMQYPGMAIDNVRQFLDTVDPAGAQSITAGFACVQPYVNDARGRRTTGYADQTGQYRLDCLHSLMAVHDTIAGRRAGYEGASSPAGYARALQSARLVVQWEEVMSNRRSRDAAMAENTMWLLDQLGPDARLVLWAHNFHVGLSTNAMGFPLRTQLGADYVPVGFSFSQGSFTAVTVGNSSQLGLTTHAVNELVPLSYEHFFSAAGQSPWLLDLRAGPVSADSAGWLTGPRYFRFIGCCYDPDLPGSHWLTARLPDLFDLVIHFDSTAPSRLLPFRYPDTFDGKPSI